MRELRALVAHRQRLVRQRTQARNRLHSVLHRHNLPPPEGDLFAPVQRSWWQGLDLPASERLRLRQDLQIFDQVQPLIAEVEAELLRLSTLAPWAGQVTFLVQLPGIGVLTAMILLSAIGEIERFPTAKKLVGYSGLGASVHDSGQTHRNGGITKQGRRELRAAMIESAWVAVEHSPHWRTEFQRLEKRLGRQKAIVAIARKLLVAVWQVLTHHVADCHADPEKVALKFMVWGEELGAQNRRGHETLAFVRHELDRVELGATLETILRGQRRFRLPATTGVIASRATPAPS